MQQQGQCQAQAKHSATPGKMVPPPQALKHQSLAQGSGLPLGVVGCNIHTINVPGSKEHYLADTTFM